MSTGGRAEGQAGAGCKEIRGSTLHCFHYFCQHGWALAGKPNHALAAYPNFTDRKQQLLRAPS